MNLARIDSSEIADINQGFGLPTRFYVSPEIFAIERREIFAKTWQFGAHRSEIAARKSAQTSTGTSAVAHLSGATFDLAVAD